MNHALSHLLRPLARLAIARGWRFADLAELLKRAYVEEARALARPKASASRISVMTGLQRRDIARLRNASDTPAPKRPDALSRLVAQWLARYRGAPLRHHGEGDSFDNLARGIRRDVHPRSMLDELLAAGTVSVAEGKVHLLKGAHVPLQGSEAQITYLGRNVGDHLAVAVKNVLGEGPAFERAVHYNGLTPEAVQTLETIWQAEMEPLLHKLNARALALQGDGPMRFRAGGYFHKETEK